ncbi:unnamed protein product, partial [Ectocarpus sp. 8 AP-2014]
SDDINDRRTAVPARDINSDESGSPGGGGRAPPRRKMKKQHRERRHHRQQRLDMDIGAAPSSSSGEDGANLASGAGRGGKRQSRLKPKHSSETPKPQEDGRYQPHDAVEARFGGRSKWFPGKVRRAYEGREGRVLYDVDFDDGDEEEGVLAGRVRRPGQQPPTLRAGLVVDIKLARKGKGYHPGTIGRVNDDGSLYVKLDDGDSEWSLSAQQAIPIYPYTGASDDQVAAPESARDENSREEPQDDADDQL